MIKRFFGLAHQPVPASAPAQSTRTLAEAEDRGFADTQPMHGYQVGFCGATHIWIHLKPGDMEPRLVYDQQDREGVHLNSRQRELMAQGKCLQVISLSDASEYWRQPREKALYLMPKTLGAAPSEDPPMQISSALTDSPHLGIWMYLKVPENDLV